MLCKVAFFLMNINKSEHLKFSKLLVDSILRHPDVLLDRQGTYLVFRGFYIVNVCSKLVN